MTPIYAPITTSTVAIRSYNLKEDLQILENISSKCLAVMLFEVR